MSIQPLPSNTVRSLGAGQVLNDPVVLLKELIENSLDAGATQISIDVSFNLLDLLQVKDNGVVQNLSGAQRADGVAW